MKDILSVRLESPAFSAGSVELFELSGREAISQLFEFELRLVSKGKDAGLDEDALLAEPMTVIFIRGDAEVRRMFGVVVSVRDALETETLHLAYTLTFVPRAFRMTLTETSEIFMDLTVPEIIKKKLERAGLREGDDFELRLAAAYPPREYVVQYKETDLQFVSRLAEHLGISFFFEHRDGRDVIVFSDDNSGFQPISDGGRAHFYARGEHMGVHRLQGTTRTIPNRYVVKDYNYRTPQVPLMASATVSEAAAGDIVEYGAHFKTPDEGERIAAIRAEELRAGRKVYEGESDVQVFSAGASVMLEGHPRGDVELLLVEVRHRLRQGAVGTGSGTEHAYTNEFRAIPYKTSYRPPRVTPKPRVHGVIPGIVEAAAKSKYAELDEAGRYHVRFIFDTSGAEDGRASRPIRMAQPHAGPGYGFHFPLRSGVEVILTCIDGDPDRPIIAGAVPNPQTPATVDAKNGRRNVIRTGGNNEINIDDTEGEERIKLSTPFGGTTFQLGSPNTPEAGAAITTSEAITSVGAAGVSTLTSVSTMVADVASVLASTSIVNLAGAASVMKALKGGLGQKLLDDLINLGKNVLDLPKQWNNYEQARLDEEAVKAQAGVDRNEQKVSERWERYVKDPNPQMSNPDGTSRPMTRQEWEARDLPTRWDTEEAALLAKQTKTAAEAHKKVITEGDNALAVRKAADALERSKTMGGAIKGTQDLISSVTKIAQKSAEAASVATANGMATAALGFAGVGRIPGIVPPVSSPVNLNAAVATSAIVGMANALVSGTSAATVSAGGQAIVAGGAAALLKSPGAVEVASGAKALITSALVDILAYARCNIKAGAHLAMKAPTVSINGATKILLKSGELGALIAGSTKINSTGEVKVKSGSSVSIQAGPTLKGSAADVSFKGKNKASLNVGAWFATVKSGNATIGGPGSKCTMTSSSAVLKSGSTVTCEKGSVTIKAPTVSLKGSGSVRLSGARIDLG